MDTTKNPNVDNTLPEEFIDYQNNTFSYWSIFTIAGESVLVATESQEVLEMMNKIMNPTGYHTTNANIKP